MTGKFEDEVLAWAPSLRAVAKARNYEHYLELMREYEAELIAKVEEVFD